MKNMRYIIKVTATATSDNPNFAREVHTYYYGKNQFLISDRAEPVNALSKYLVTKYGYNRRYDAVKASNFWDNNTHDAKYWNYTVDIIEYTL